MRCILFLIVAVVLFPAFGYCLEITGLEIKPTAHGEHVRIALSARTKYSAAVSDTKSSRVVVSLPGALMSDEVELPEDFNDPFVTNVRFFRKDNKPNRLVLDFNSAVKVQGAVLVLKKHSYWLVFDVVKEISTHVKGASQPVKQEKAEKLPEKANAKPIIIIDAGHGGQDDGTSGYANSKEKNLTLDYAKSLKEALLDTGHYDVVLTRSDDTYLLLGERVKRARLAKGNLFISIHADSSPSDDARGLSVYTISEKASDKQSAALAEKENKADIIGGMDLSGTSKDVADILIELTQRETRTKSNKFADMLVKSFRHEVHLLNHTHRQAGFAVLKAPDIPSVLIEVGFLSNPNEEELLHSSFYQEKFQHGVIHAVNAYFGK